MRRRRRRREEGLVLEDLVLGKARPVCEEVGARVEVPVAPELAVLDPGRLAHAWGLDSRIERGVGGEKGWRGKVS